MSDKIHSWEEAKDVEKLGSLIFKDVIKNCSTMYDLYDDNVSEETDKAGIDGYLRNETQKTQVQLKVELYPNCFLETYQEAYSGPLEWSKDGWALDNNLTEGDKIIFWINPLGILVGTGLGFLLEMKLLEAKAETLGLTKKKANNKEYWSEGIPVRYDRMPIWFESVKQLYLWDEVVDKLDNKPLLDKFLSKQKKARDWNELDNPLERNII